MNRGFFLPAKEKIRNIGHSMRASRAYERPAGLALPRPASPLLALMGPIRGSFSLFVFIFNMSSALTQRLVALLILVTSLTLLSCSPKNDRKHGVIALTPSLAEVVLALEDQSSSSLIAVSPWTVDDRVAALPKLDPASSLERIVDMRPALVLLHPSDQILHAKLEKLHVPVMAFSMDTIEEINRSISEIGQALDRSEISKTLVGSLKQTLLDNASRFKTDAQIPALVVIDRLDTRYQQLYIAQSPAYLASLVRGCGFEPLMVSSQKWARIDAETLIRLNPRFILFFARGPEDAESLRKQFASVYPMLDAVKNEAFLVYDNPDITVPGPEIGKRQAELCYEMHRFVQALGWLEPANSGNI